MGMLERKHVRFGNLTFGQRAAIRKLERLNGWNAVTITEHPVKGHDYQTVNVIFDTGPRRLDFATVMLDRAGWSVTRGNDHGCKRILTVAEFTEAYDVEMAKIQRMAA
jgi:hypothetical protein